MVVMVALVQFVHRFAGFEVVAQQDAGLLELGEHAVDGGDADFDAVFQQDAVNVFRTQVQIGVGFEQVEDFQARAGNFQTVVFQLGDVVHGFAFSIHSDKDGAYNSKLFAPADSQTIKVFNWHFICGRGAWYLARFSLRRRRRKPQANARKTVFNPYRKADNVKPLLRWMTVASALCGLAACTPSLVNKLPYYKMPVVQGVPLNPESVLAVKPGMSREQVQLEIGAPVLNPSFRQDRWDYTYELSRGGKIKEQRTLTVFFENGTVSRVEGDALEHARRVLQEKQEGKAQ